MEGEGQEGAAVETASPAVDPAADPAQAPSQPAQPAAEKQPPFHEHPRWQQMLGQNRQLQGTVQQLSQRIQQMEALQQKAAQQGSLSAADLAQYQEAGAAMEKIMQATDWGRDLLAMRAQKAQLESGQQTLTRIQQQQAQALSRQSISHITNLAEKAGYDVKNQPWVASLVRGIAAHALATPGANERFDQGDLTVLDEVFKEYQETFLSRLQRAGQAQTLATKQRTASLPPAPRGGAAGPPGLPKFDGSKPNAIPQRFDDLARAASQMLADGGPKE